VRTFDYLPRRKALTSPNTEQVDLLRVPFGVTDAGVTTAELCTPPAITDGGP
jgi:hypothetical protein